ncbi:MAG: YihY/virulence factor BrkB family protein [Candidatus Korobacteraceae bacterium]
MRVRQWKRVVVNVFTDVNQNHIFPFAAALSYYFLLALFPALIAVATFVGYLPIPHLFNTIVAAMAQVVPPESMGLVRRVVADVTLYNHPALLSFGLLAALWTCSSAFATMIEALNVAYDVPETRPMWKTRLLAFELTFLVGLLVAVAFVFLVVGPHFGKFLAGELGLTKTFAAFWPISQHALAAILMVLAIEGLYFMAPNVKHSFSASLPGAVFAVLGWILLSDGLSLYFQKFEHLNKTYGVLGGGIALLVWLYWTGFIILVGAELNSELLKLSNNADVAPQPPPKPQSHAASQRTTQRVAVIPSPPDRR